MRSLTLLLILFGNLAYADIPADQILPREAKAVADSDEIKDLLPVLGSHHHMDCPAVKAEDVKMEVPADAKNKRHNFSLSLTCKGTFGEVDETVDLAGSTLWIGGDIDIALFRLESIQITPILN
jgi:hypothetical protein